MSKTKLAGSFVALITPFNRDGSVDFEAFRTLLKFQAEHGTSAVLIMGSTGETSMLTPEEKKHIIVETTKMKTAAIPIFYGCTGNNTESTIANVRFARDHGADGAILAAPAYICAPEHDIERFFLDVADATDLDVWRKLAEGELYDLVITTETFEHVKDWSVIVAGVSAALRPGGWFVGTCASVGRRPHGARGAHCPAPDEWYANIAPDALVASLMTSNFRGEVVTEYSWRPSFPTTNDLYWRAQR